MKSSLDSHPTTVLKYKRTTLGSVSLLVLLAMTFLLCVTIVLLTIGSLSMTQPMSGKSQLSSQKDVIPNLVSTNEEPQ